LKSVNRNIHNILVDELAQPHKRRLIQLLTVQADKLQTLITAAKVPEVEPIWCTLFAKALDGKNLKDMLLNVGSGGAAAAPAAGGAAAGGAAAAAEEAPKEEEKAADKEESDDGELPRGTLADAEISANNLARRHGIRSFRLSVSPNAGAVLFFLRRLGKIYIDDENTRAIACRTWCAIS
jgi:large subunit ribosomal protein LP1